MHYVPHCSQAHCQGFLLPLAPHPMLIVMFVTVHLIAVRAGFHLSQLLDRNHPGEVGFDSGVRFEIEIFHQNIE